MAKHKFTDYYLVVNLDERGDYSASVYDPNDKSIFEIESAEQVREMQDDGFLKYKPDEDLDRLTKYLMDMETIPSGSQIYSEDEFESKIRDKYEEEESGNYDIELIENVEGKSKRKWRGVVSEETYNRLDSLQSQGGFKRYSIDLYDDKSEDSVSEKGLSDFMESIGVKYGKGGNVSKEPMTITATSDIMSVEDAMNVAMRHSHLLKVGEEVIVRGSGIPKRFKKSGEELIFVGREKMAKGGKVGFWDRLFGGKKKKYGKYQVSYVDHLGYEKRDFYDDYETANRAFEARKKDSSWIAFGEWGGAGEPDLYGEWKDVAYDKGIAQFEKGSSMATGGGVRKKKELEESLEALKKFGANIELVGKGKKKWWIEDNGIWGLLEEEEGGMYEDDDGIIELAEQYAENELNEIRGGSMATGGGVKEEFEVATFDSFDDSNAQVVEGGLSYKEAEKMAKKLWASGKYYGVEVIDSDPNNSEPIVWVKSKYNKKSSGGSMATGGGVEASDKVYTFLAGKGDRRSKEYKLLDAKVDELTSKYGKDSKELNDFFDSNLQEQIELLSNKSSVGSMGKGGRTGGDSISWLITG